MIESTAMGELKAMDGEKTMNSIINTGSTLAVS